LQHLGDRPSIIPAILNKLSTAALLGIVELPFTNA